jgi:hypothetical protein
MTGMTAKGLAETGMLDTSAFEWLSPINQPGFCI